MAQPVGTPRVSVEQQPVQPVLAPEKLQTVGVPQTLAVPTPPAQQTQPSNPDLVRQGAVAHPSQTAVELQPPIQIADISIPNTPIPLLGDAPFTGGVLEIGRVINEINESHMKIDQQKADLTQSLPATPAPVAPQREPQPIQGKQ